MEVDISSEGGQMAQPDLSGHQKSTLAWLFHQVTGQLVGRLHSEVPPPAD